MTPDDGRAFVLTVLRHWRNPLLALATPMGHVLRQRQYGVIVLAMPHWIADGVLIDALAKGVENIAHLPTAIIPGTMFRPALSKPKVLRNIKEYASERHMIIVVGYPLTTVLAPTSDRVKGFAAPADYVVHTYPELGAGLELCFLKIHPATQGVPKSSVVVDLESLGAPLDWESRSAGATVMITASV
jgi:hypothetical protein